MPNPSAVKAFATMAYALVLGAFLSLGNTPPLHAQDAPSKASEVNQWWRPKGAAGENARISAEERQRIFGEEAKNLADNVTDDLRRTAIEKILKAAGHHQATPIVQVLSQRAPEKAFRQLIALIVDEKPTLDVQRREFVGPLVRALPQVDTKLATTLREILTRPNLAPTTVVEVKGALVSKDATVALAGIEVAALRPNGTRGVVTLLEPLVALLDSTDDNLKVRAAMALRKATYLSLPDAASWQKWLRFHEDAAERASAIADAAVAEAKRVMAEVGTLRGELLKERLAAMDQNEKNDVVLLIKRLDDDWPQIRAAAIGYLEALLPSLAGDDADAVLTALFKRFEANPHESDANLSLAARALQKAPNPSSTVLLEGLGRVLRHNGLPTPATVELVAALRAADALPLVADLIERKDHPARPIGDAIHLALVKQLQTCAGGADAERQADALARIFAALDARLARTPTSDVKQAYVSEVRSLLSVLGLLVQYGRDISAITNGLLNAATIDAELRATILNALSINLARNPQSAIAAINANKGAQAKIKALALALPDDMPAALYRQAETLVALAGRSQTSDAELSKHWRQLLLASLAKKENGKPEAALQKALAWGGLVASPEADLSTAYSELVAAQGEKGREALVQGCDYLKGEESAAKVLAGVLARLTSATEVEKLDLLATAAKTLVEKDSATALAAQEAALLKTIDASTKKILEGDFKQGDGKALVALLHVKSARAIADALILDLEKNATEGDRRNELSEALAAAFKLIPDLEDRELKLEGKADAFLLALKSAKERLTKLDG